MAAKQTYKETYAQAVTVIARRHYVFTRPEGSIYDLIEFNKRIKEKTEALIFKANKYERHPKKRNYRPSRSKDWPNENVDLTFLRNAANAILEGTGEKPPKIAQNGQPEILLLDKKIIEHILPFFDFMHFQKFNYFCQNLDNYRDLMRRGHKVTDEEATKVRTDLKDFTKAAAAIAILLEHKVIFQLTNYYMHPKNKLCADLQQVSCKRDFGKKNAFLNFLGRIRSMDKIMHEIFVPDLFLSVPQPLMHSQSKITARRGANLNQSEIQQQITPQLIPLEPSPAQMQRSEAANPNPRSKPRKRSATIKKPSAACERKHNAAQAGLFV